MEDKKQYYKLDDIGFVGTQENMPAYLRKRIQKKTGEIFQAAREKKTGSSKRTTGKIKKTP